MLHITTGSGKMKGVYSINTATTTNEFCKNASKTYDVCKKCYAMRYEKIRTHLTTCFDKNSKLLTSDKFKPQSVPFKFIRLHSFGELIDYTHFANFIKLIDYNTDTIFTLWTKRKNLVNQYVENGNTIPKNLILIYSNPHLNTPITKAPNHFDKVFNVFNKKNADLNGVNINCGKSSCTDCMKCYSFNSIEVINELIK